MDIIKNKARCITKNSTIVLKRYCAISLQLHAWMFLPVKHHPETVTVDLYNFRLTSFRKIVF